MALKEDNDTTGDVISVNGDATKVPLAEDRGDVFDPPEATDSPVEPPADAPATTGKKQGSDHVPIGRFNEVNSEKKELAARLEEMESENERLRTASVTKTAPVQAPDLEPAFNEDAQEAAYIEALLDGDAVKASAIRKTINANIRNQSIAAATETVRGEVSARETASALDKASQQAVADFPYLDTDQGEEAIDLILASRDRRVAQGVPIAEALSKAVAAIAPRFAPADETHPDGKEPIKDMRTANALARGAADSVAQPPAIQAGIGNRATAGKVVASQLTDEQFDALTPAEKKKLRGD